MDPLSCEKYIYFKYLQNFAWDFIDSLSASLIHGCLYLDSGLRTYTVDDFYGLQPDLIFELKILENRSQQEKPKAGQTDFFPPTNRQEIQINVQGWTESFTFSSLNKDKSWPYL